MPRPFLAPDPGYRSPNEPTTIVSSAQVLGLYNQEHPDDKRERVSEHVKQWYVSEMTKLGWAAATFHGSQCVLEANVVLRKQK